MHVQAPPEQAKPSPSFLSSLVPARLVIAGDFNLHHEEWQRVTAVTYVRTQARELVDWAALNGISLTSQHGKQTHTSQAVYSTWRGGLIARVARDIIIPSDH
jgi:hypothetical protein